MPATARRRYAFLSTDDLEDFVIYDELTYPEFARRGVEIEAVPWRAPGVDWGRYEVVVIRSPWDYQQEATRFLAVLEEIDRKTRLENALDLVRFNLEKTYLRTLEERGVPVVPTLWIERGFEPTAALFESWRERLDSAELVLKPTISANADHTYHLDRETFASRSRELAVAFAERNALAQPFLQGVVHEGEYSLFYFGGSYSHAVLKTPQAGDFRVQEEHGGRIQAVRPEPALLAVAGQTLAALDRVPLYARVDLVRSVGGGFLLMELELIEPSLYFPYDEGSIVRFVDAVLGVASS